MTLAAHARKLSYLVQGEDAYYVVSCQRVPAAGHTVFVQEDAGQQCCAQLEALCEDGSVDLVVLGSGEKRRLQRAQISVFDRIVGEQFF